MKITTGANPACSSNYNLVLHIFKTTEGRGEEGNTEGMKLRRIKRKERREAGDASLQDNKSCVLGF